MFVAPSASAGWAGSRYEKSECTFQVNQGGRPGLYCETTFIVRFSFLDEFTVADSSCPSGERTMRREQTFEETWMGFDIYHGPAPIAQFAFAGNESPISSPRLLSDVTTALGCAP